MAAIPESGRSILMKFNAVTDSKRPTSDIRFKSFLLHPAGKATAALPLADLPDLRDYPQYLVQIRTPNIHNTPIHRAYMGATNTIEANTRPNVTPVSKI